MRMEELTDSRYIKSTDSVERYLLNLVQEYFKNSNIASTTSREYIIKKAVERMKEELSFDSIGVLSITLADGEKRTGAVTITLEDLNGEPLIQEKLSAFNVPFGQEQNTACEGNDPRLSDAREPLEHNHEISDVIGLEGILSTLTGKIERINGYLHEHDNKNVLDILVYTGEKTSIDLAILETLEDKVIKIVESIRQDIINYKNDVAQKIQEINQKIVEVKNKITELRQYVLDTNKEYLEKSKDYTDDEIQVATDKIEAEMEKLVTKSMLTDVLNVASNTYTLIDSIDILLSDTININATEIPTHEEQLINIPTGILAEIQNRNTSLEECQFDIKIEYYHPSYRIDVKGPLPYITFTDNIISSTLKASVVYDSKQILITYDMVGGVFPNELKEARIKCDVYSKREVTLS